MIGKIIGGTYKIVAKAIYATPIIGKPTYRALEFFMVNLFKAIKRLPYVIGGIFVLWFGLSFFGVL